MLSNVVGFAGQQIELSPGCTGTQVLKLKILLLPYQFIVCFTVASVTCGAGSLSFAPPFHSSFFRLTCHRVKCWTNGTWLILTQFWASFSDDPFANLNKLQFCLNIFQCLVSVQKRYSRTAKYISSILCAISSCFFFSVCSALVWCNGSLLEQRCSTQHLWMNENSGISDRRGNVA